jgi:hypothetical protein
MKKFSICDAYAVLGSVIGLGLFLMVTIFFVLMRHHGEVRDHLGLIFMVILPASFMIGGGFSGYFCQPYIRKSYLFIFVSPGPYALIFAIVVICGNAINGKGDLGYWLPVCAGLAVFIFSSIVGVYLGKYLREARTKRGH